MGSQGFQRVGLRWASCMETFYVVFLFVCFYLASTNTYIKQYIKESVERISSRLVSSHYQPLIREGCGDVTALSLLFQGVAGVTGANPSYLSGRRQGTPWTSHQLIAGPLLMAEAATQGAICTSGAILGFSIFSSAPGEPGFEPATFQSLMCRKTPVAFNSD